MITYCTNIHPGDTWEAVCSQLEGHTLDVKRAVCPDRPFPVGLRLSARAAGEVGADEARRFGDWCAGHGLFVCTLNGFPYGRFHGVPVKERVYLPDWRDPARLEYTERLVALLAQWLPQGLTGSISTVPLGYRTALEGDDLGPALRNLERALLCVARVAQTVGKRLVLSVEPEPGCYLETTDDVVRFFETLPFSAELRSHLAVCYDCCHQALQYESPAHSLSALRRAGIPVGHVQVSSALRVAGDRLSALEPFCEPCYLHQTVGRRGDGSLVRFPDLPPALTCDERVEEWRAHFHVPVFLDRAGACGTTRGFLEHALPLFEPEVLLEVETYTWGVLPPELRTETVTASLVRELEWVSRHRVPQGR